MHASDGTYIKTYAGNYYTPDTLKLTTGSDVCEVDEDEEKQVIFFLFIAFQFLMPAADNMPKNMTVSTAYKPEPDWT